MTNKLIILACIATIVMVYHFGLPNEISIGAFSWCIEECDSQETPIIINNNYDKNQEISSIPHDILSISTLKSRQKIYSPDEQAIVDFSIEDEQNIPYNITVNWFYNDTRYHGWYNESNKSQPFYAWFTTNQKGTWNVQVLLRWNYNNLQYSKDETTEVIIK